MPSSASSPVSSPTSSPASISHLGILSTDESKSRLAQLQILWDIRLPSLVPVLRPPSPVQERTTDAEIAADTLLRRRQLESSAVAKKDNSIKRAFTSRNKRTWAIPELLDALTVLAREGGDAGIATVLLDRLEGLGGNINMAATGKRPSLMGRRKSDATLTAPERPPIFQTSVEKGHVNLARIFITYADQHALDTAITSAANQRNASMISLLVSHGADLFRTPAGETAFRNLCALGGLSDMLCPIVAAVQSCSPVALSVGIVDAVKAGCLDTLLVLVQSTGDADLNGGEALKAAVMMGRRDLVMGLLLARRPPRAASAEAALDLLFQDGGFGGDNVDIAELLLCAGAKGDAAGRALIKAVSAGALDTTRLLVRYGASLQYQDGAAVREAVSKGNNNLLSALLDGNAPLSPAIASECIGLIPAHIDQDCRKAILTMLLHKGANGDALNKALIAAVRAGDEKTVELLVTPAFNGTVGRESPGRKSVNSHAIASVDFNEGEAISIALAAGDLGILVVLLQVGPSPDTLRSTFGATRRLSKEDRRTAIQAFLMAGLPSDTITLEFQREMEQLPAHRDDQLIAILLSYAPSSPKSPDSESSLPTGSAVVKAISREDRGLLATVLQHSSGEAAAEGLPCAAGISDREMRREMIALLLEGGAECGKEEVLGAVQKVLSEDTVDVKLLRLLLTRGQADLNMKSGSVLITAVDHKDTLILPLILKNTTLSPRTVTVAVSHLLKSTTTKTTTSHLLALLRLPCDKLALSALLPLAVESYLATPLTLRSTVPLSALLTAGASVNAPGGLGLARAVGSAHMPLTDMLLGQGASGETVAVAFRQAVNILDPMDRFTFVERLLKVGMASEEVGMALVYSIRKYPEDLGLLKLLIEEADVSDGQALIAAVETAKATIVALLLHNSHPTSVLDSAFSKALLVSDRVARLEVCGALLTAPVSPGLIRSSLTAVAPQADLELVHLLVRQGAQLNDVSGQAIIQAARTGKVEMLAAILENGGEARASDAEMLTAAFHAATEVGDLEKRCGIVQLLLKTEKVPRDVLSAELLTAARYGDAGIGLLKALMEHGADPNWQRAAALCSATECAFRSTLEVLLGRLPGVSKQTKPTPTSLAFALKATWKLSRDTRLEVVTWLFEAGLLPCTELHEALERAVTYDFEAGEKPDLPILQLLLEHGASPTYHDCGPLITAASVPDVAVLQILLDNVEGGITDEEALTVFENVFVETGRDRWLSEPGYACMASLLSKGAAGECLNVALSACVGGANTVDRQVVATKMVTLLLGHGALVKYDGFSCLMSAIAIGSLEITEMLLLSPLDVPITEKTVVCLIEAGHGEDVTEGLLCTLVKSSRGKIEGSGHTVLQTALRQWPNNLEIPTLLLDVGFSADETIYACLPNKPMEDLPLLVWLFADPSRDVSPEMIDLLVSHGANANCKASSTGTTPLMAAVTALRPRCVARLIMHEADVNAIDATGTTPLFMAASVPGPAATEIIELLLVMKPDVDDGSLHAAAGRLNIEGMEMLLRSGHAPDFPSIRHGGRSALAEICLNGCRIPDQEAPPPLKRTLQKAISLLLSYHSNAQLLHHHPPTSTVPPITILHLTFFSPAPVTTLAALLQAGLWRSLSESWTLYTYKNHVYSLTRYLNHFHSSMPALDKLLTILRLNRAPDTYYSLTNPQPPDAVNVPEALAAAEATRIVLESQRRMSRADHAERLAQVRSAALLQTQLSESQAAADKRQKDALHVQEIEHLRARRVAEIHHIRMMTQEKQRLFQLEHTHLRSVDALLATRQSRERDSIATSNKGLLDFESKLHQARLENQRTLAAIQYDRQQTMARFEREAGERELVRIRAQKNLIKEQSALAMQLGGARSMTGAKPGQLGFVEDL